MFPDVIIRLLLTSIAEDNVQFAGIHDSSTVKAALITFEVNHTEHFEQI